MTAKSQYKTNEKDFVKIYEEIERAYEVKLSTSLLPPLICDSDIAGVIQSMRYKPKKKEITTSQRVIISENTIRNECETYDVSVLDVLKRRFAHEYSHIAVSRCAPRLTVNKLFCEIAVRELNSSIGAYFDLSLPSELYKRIESSLSLDEAVACAGEELVLDKLSLDSIADREKKIKVDVLKPLIWSVDVDGKDFDFKGLLVNYLHEKVLKVVNNGNKLSNVIRNASSFVLEPPFLKGRENIKVVFKDPK
jgi:hypothetical protein